MKIAFVMSTPFAFGGEQRVVSVISNILTVNKNNVDIICMEPNYEENYITKCKKAQQKHDHILSCSY